jgi:hypothetical protein
MLAFGGSGGIWYHPGKSVEVVKLPNATPGAIQNINTKKRSFKLWGAILYGPYDTSLFQETVELGVRPLGWILGNPRLYFVTTPLDLSLGTDRPTTVQS